MSSSESTGFGQSRQTTPRPIIFHGVAASERYVGLDGEVRPYAVVFPDARRDLLRRRQTTETGAFGKSNRRTRSRSATATKREIDPTIQSGHHVFGAYIAGTKENNDNKSTTPARQRKQSVLKGESLSLDADVKQKALMDAPQFTRQPTEAILRGFATQTQQYAVIDHYERLAGPILEGYAREPPVESRRYKSELRKSVSSPAFSLTAQSRDKIATFVGGEHWVKVTFESAEAAQAAYAASPQKVQGYIIYAEPYIGLHPQDDVAYPDLPWGEVEAGKGTQFHGRRRSSAANRSLRARTTATIYRPAISSSSGRPGPLVTFDSPTSSRTLDTATASTATVTGHAATGAAAGGDLGIEQDEEEEEEYDPLYCRKIRTARRVQLRPAEQALLPPTDFSSSIMSRSPTLQWLSVTIIGNEVPRTDAGEFDFAKAGWYWYVMYWLDYFFGIFSGDIVATDMDD